MSAPEAHVLRPVVTEKSYVHWIRRYLCFHEGKHPGELAEEDVNRFLSDLATTRKVAAATQNQALAAVLFLYKHVLEQPLSRVEGIVRAPQAQAAPGRPDEGRGRRHAVVPQRHAATRLHAAVRIGLAFDRGLAAPSEGVDFGRGEVVVRDGKGRKDRVTMLPEILHEPLAAHLLAVRDQHERDLVQGLGRVPLPGALSKKYRGADRDWPWQWVFPATSHYTDRTRGTRHRHHLHESVVSRAVRAAAVHLGLPSG